MSSDLLFAIVLPSFDALNLYPEEPLECIVRSMTMLGL